MKTDPKGKSGDTLYYTKPQQPLCRATEDQGRGSLRSRCTVNNVEFSFIKVAVRYIQYIAYTVLIEMMQIVLLDEQFRGTNVITLRSPIMNSRTSSLGGTHVMTL